MCHNNESDNKHMIFIDQKYRLFYLTTFSVDFKNILRIV